MARLVLWLFLGAAGCGSAAASRAGHSLVVRVLTGLAVFVSFLACSAGRVTSSRTADGATADAVDNVERIVIPIHVTDALPINALSVLSCTRDRHGVLDGTGSLIETCPPDQGCLDGACVPACQAISAAHGNVGCDFLIARPPALAYPTACFAVFIANNWDKAVKINVSRAEQSYDSEQFARISATGTPETSWAPVPANGIPTGKVAVLFLEGGPKQIRGCPVQAAVDTYTIIEKTGRGQAWHIVTDIPVSVYDIYPYGGADSALPSAQLVLPTSAFGENYVAVVPMFQLTKRTISFIQSQWAQIIAVQNDTEVKVVPAADLPSGSGVAGAQKNSIATYTLSAGEVIQWNQEDGKKMEITGSIVSSNRPIGFVGGNEYLCMDSSTSNNGGCDSAHQMIPPVNALGNQYAVAPHPNRRSDEQQESIWYRVVGAVNDTALLYDPPTPGAPTALAQGQWYDFEAVGAFEVASQDNIHPFYIAQTMSGSGVIGARPGNLGDEEFVNIVPPAQFLSSYVFYTDPSYTMTSLVLTQCDEGRGFKDVEITCLGAVAGWSPMGSNGRCRWATVNLVDGGNGIGACHDGPQSAHSDEPFGLTVWGLARCASYAYPAGASVTPINPIVVPPLPIP